MADAPEPLKGLKTWSHLAERRRRPSEYEIVSTNLHYRRDDPACPWELDPGLPMNEWYRTHCNESPLRHADWDSFRDPDELVYRTYNLEQDSQETYVRGLLEEMADRRHDASLAEDWVATLARAYAPARYLFHALQMGSAYLAQIAPASTITNCATFQAADSLRWLTHVAYRTIELGKTRHGHGLGERERERWEDDEAWQGFRELAEKALVAWDWGESFVAWNLVAKPAVEEAVLGELGRAARERGDRLLDLILASERRDAERHRRWSRALVTLALTQDGNTAPLAEWLGKWAPLADRAIDVYCEALPIPGGAADAKARCGDFRASLGV